MLVREDVMEIIEFLPQIAETGLLGVFLVIVIIFLWNVRKERHATVREKDKEIKDLNEKVLDAFKKNTESNLRVAEGQRGIKEAIEGNTRASETLTDAVYQVLTRNK